MAKMGQEEVTVWKRRENGNWFWEKEMMENKY